MKGGGSPLFAGKLNGGGGPENLGGGKLFCPSKAGGGGMPGGGPCCPSRWGGMEGSNIRGAGPLWAIGGNGGGGPLRGMIF